MRLEIIVVTTLLMLCTTKAHGDLSNEIYVRASEEYKTEKWTEAAHDFKEYKKLDTTFLKANPREAAEIEEAIKFCEAHERIHLGAAAKKASHHNYRTNAASSSAASGALN